VQEERGKILMTPAGRRVLITVHPSALLRLPPGADAEGEFERFVSDLRSVPEELRGG